MYKFHFETGCFVVAESSDDALMENSPGTAGEIPEVDVAAIPFRANPRRKDSMLMWVIERKRCGDDFTGW